MTPALEKNAFRLQGRLTVQGIDIAVENQPGSVRKGVGKNGKKWRTVMRFPYGYLVGTEGVDGDEVDAYVGPDRGAPDAYVVHQRREDGKGYDEDKVFFGLRSLSETRAAFLAHYDSPKFLGPIEAIPIETLKRLLKTSRGRKLTLVEPRQEKRAPDGRRGDTKVAGNLCNHVPRAVHVERLLSGELLQAWGGGGVTSSS